MIAQTEQLPATRSEPVEQASLPRKRTESRNNRVYPNNGTFSKNMTNNHKEALLKQLQDKTAQVAILGLGYVGLPLAVVFAEAGFHVTRHRPGCNVKLTRFNSGESHIQDVPTEQVNRLVANGKLQATTDFSHYCRRTQSVFACQRHCAKPETRICHSSWTPQKNWRSICTLEW